MKTTPKSRQVLLVPPKLTWFEHPLDLPLTCHTRAETLPVTCSCGRYRLDWSEWERRSGYKDPVSEEDVERIFNEVVDQMRLIDDAVYPSKRFWRSLEDTPEEGEQERTHAT